MDQSLALFMLLDRIVDDSRHHADLVPVFLVLILTLHCFLDLQLELVLILRLLVLREGVQGAPTCLTPLELLARYLFMLLFCLWDP